MDIYTDIKSKLINGQFDPGQKLKSQNLADIYSTSASRIREILFRLSTRGLVDFKEQRGFSVPQVDETRRRELVGMRVMLECEGAKRSIGLGGLDWSARLTAAHHKLSHIESMVRDAPGDPEQFINENNLELNLWTTAELDFHRTLISACGSDLLLDTHLLIFERFRQQVLLADQRQVYFDGNIDQHLGILEAALAHDSDILVERITEHLSRDIYNGLEKT